MSNEKNIKLSKQLSYILRHAPWEYGLEMDTKGYVSINSLIETLEMRGKKLNRNVLQEIVDTDGKGRYEIQGDYIRAVQGHSIEWVEVENEIKTPPKILYHGTSKKSLDSILNSGIKKMNRNKVHLSDNLETAINVGSRHGEVIVLEIDTESMSADGHIFELSKNKVWLTENIDTKYIKVSSM